MKKIGEISFPGASGKEYTFKIFPYDTEFKSVGCVYIVTVRNPVEGGASYGHTALFAGQSAAMDQTWTTDHPQRDCFQKNGADFICIYDEDEEKARQAIVDDLTKKLQLKCAG
jgi:hypothetical protein